MYCPSRWFSCSAPVVSGRLVVVAAALGGCQADNLQIVRAPFVSPYVLPGAGDQFMLTLAVKNYSDEPYEGGAYLRIYQEWFPTANVPSPCTSEAFVSVPPLEPDESWALVDRPISTDRDCPCVEGDCDGHLWLSLVWGPVNGPPLPGPNTDLHIVWDKSGDLDKMTVTNVD